MRNGLLVLAACSLLVGCGSNQAANDAGADADPGDAGGITCPDAGSDPSLASANPPVGTQLQVGDDLSVRGVTVDGYVVYSDNAARTLHAVPVAGGPAQDLGPLGPKFWVVVSGVLVFSWSNVDDANVGALSTWSAAGGLHGVAPASLALVAVSSPTADRILYVDHMDAAGSRGDIEVAAADGSGAAKLVSSIYANGCLPQLGFVGSYALASHCDAEPGATPPATVSSFLAPTWSRVDLATHAQAFFWANDVTQRVLYSTGPGVAVVPVGGGAASVLDADGFWGALTSDGKTALYTTMNQAMRRASVAAPAPETLVPSHVGGFWGVSPDDRWVLYFSQLGQGGGDVHLASAVTPGPSATLLADPSGGPVGDAFTADSTHAVYVGGVDPCTGAGTLQALAVGETSPRVLGERAWIDWSLGGSRVIFVDNFFESDALRYGRGDIEWVDLAQAAPPTRLVDRADAVIGLSPGGDQVVYTWSARPGALAGLYVAPIP